MLRFCLVLAAAGLAVPGAECFVGQSAAVARPHQGSLALRAQDRSYGPQPQVASASETALSRRDALSFLTSAAAFGAVGLAAPQPSAAKDVGSGGLPGGLMEFQSILLSKKQWSDIGNRVETGHGEMDEKEWQNVQGFLRKFYEQGDNMVLVSKAFRKDEQEAVSEVAKNFRKAVKAIDKPAASKDWEAFMTQHKEVAGYITRFLDIRAGKLNEKDSAVPDL